VGQLRHSDDETPVVKLYGRPAREQTIERIRREYGDNVRRLEAVSGNFGGAQREIMPKCRRVRRVNPAPPTSIRFFAVARTARRSSPRPGGCKALGDGLILYSPSRGMENGAVGASMRAICRMGRHQRRRGSIGVVESGWTSTAPGRRGWRARSSSL
jgi:hypothetical protein